jgi:TetR/AcrR family transcriptional repressor of nem operon
MKTTQAPAKKQAILEAATQLMLDKGYVATTVDEICAAAGVTKGSFFYYFKNKEDLGKALIFHFSERQHGMFQEKLAGIDDPLDRIYAFLDLVIQMSRDCCHKGCLVGTFIQELHESHPELKTLCSESFQTHAEYLKVELAAVQEKYAPDRGIEVQGLAESFMALTQGAMILIKAHGDRSIMERTLTHYRTYLQGLFGR